MKTHEEIKKALERCGEAYCCMGCAYLADFGKPTGCMDYLNSDALAYIEQLEERISLMLIQMSGDCGTCKHRDGNTIHDCYSCMTSMTGDHPLWEYEGFPGEDTIHEKPV